MSRRLLPLKDQCRKKAVSHPGPQFVHPAVHDLWLHTGPLAEAGRDKWFSGGGALDGMCVLSVMKRRLSAPSATLANNSRERHRARWDVLPSSSDRGTGECVVWSGSSHLQAVHPGTVRPSLRLSGSLFDHSMARAVPRCEACPAQSFCYPPRGLALDHSRAMCPPHRHHAAPAKRCGARPPPAGATWWRAATGDRLSGRSGPPGGSASGVDVVRRPAAKAARCADGGRRCLPTEVRVLEKSGRSDDIAGRLEAEPILLQATRRRAHQGLRNTSRRVAWSHV